MKKFKIIAPIIIGLITVFFCLQSCSPEIIENEKVTEKQNNKRPNVEVNSVEFDLNSKLISNLKRNAKYVNKTSKLNESYLETSFGKIYLKDGVEVIDSLKRKTTTFEVIEKIKSKNSYLNFVIQNEKYYLYKVEKTERSYNKLPAKSVIISKLRLNEDLSSAGPCDTIKMPPFGYYEPDELINMVNGPGGGFIGNYNDPNNGIPPFATTGPYTNFWINLYTFNNGGSSSGSTSSGNSSGGGGDSGSGQQSLIEAQWDAFWSDVSRWWRNLWSGCNCPRRMAEGSKDENTAMSGGVVVTIKEGPCGGDGFVYLIDQNETVDAINNFANYFTYNSNNDKIFLYANAVPIVDELKVIAEANKTNQNLMQAIPHLITQMRNGKIDWEKAKDVFNYLIQNSNTTLEQYLNWFSFESPGLESNEPYDEAYWDNPNLVFPPKTLPTFANFKLNYPSSVFSSKELCTEIGGQVLTLYNAIINDNDEMNTCAVRISVALNKSGITIPNLPGKTKTGADGKNYFTFAKDVNHLMIRTFGTNSNTNLGPLNAKHKRFYYNHIQQYINPTNGNVLSSNNPLANNQGIYSLISNNDSWSTGHCDVLHNNTMCKNHCHFEGPIKHIDIWILE
jgi:Type VI secretion system (T6SS), amidase effector protein 4